jgi:hypothetical protein
VVHVSHNHNLFFAAHAWHTFFTAAKHAPWYCQRPNQGPVVGIRSFLLIAILKVVSVTHPVPHPLLLKYAEVTSQPTTMEHCASNDPTHEPRQHVAMVAMQVETVSNSSHGLYHSCGVDHGVS